LSPAAGSVVELARFPVKSMAGERLGRARFGPLGLEGDRRWAVYTGDGGIGSGKTTRRFRRVDGLLDLRAQLPGDHARRSPVTEGPDLTTAEAVPTVTFPDGRRYRADDARATAALTGRFGQPLRLRPESSVVHHDESRVHVITTAGLRALEQLIGRPVEAARFRANLVLAVDGDGFVEDDWPGRTLALGNDVRLELGAGMPRCVMVGLPQPRADLLPEPRLLKDLGRVHQVIFGLQAEVVRPGIVNLGDVARLL
jgi:uncharacterized protein YcbX